MPFDELDSYGAEGPETVLLKFPLSLVRLLETFGSRFFVYSAERRAYVGRPNIAPAICRIIAGDAARGEQLMQAVENAYAEYIAVQSRVDQPVPKPIP